MMEERNSDECRYIYICKGNSSLGVSVFLARLFAEGWGYWCKLQLGIMVKEAGNDCSEEIERTEFR
jgi:hypothetical protein